MNKILQKLSILSLVISGLTLNAQNVGINATGAAPDAGSLLDISSTTKGLLIPRVSIANLATIAPVTGSATTSMLVYNTNAGTGLGYHYWDGAAWIPFLTGASVDNGLYFNTGAARVRLGGPLVENTTVTQGAFGMTWNLSGTGDFNVQDAGATRFSVQDNGRVTVGGTANATNFNVTGTSYFSNDLYLRDGAVTAGDFLVRIYDSADDGVIDVYENNAMNHRIHGNGATIFNEQGLSLGFRVESNTQANAFNINGGTDQIGFFIANSPFPVIRMEANFNDAAFPWVRYINTNAASGTAFIGVGQNAASGGTWIPGVGLSGTSDNAFGISGHALTNTVSAYGGYFENDGAFASVGGWQSGPWVIRKIVGNGTVNTIVDGLNNDKVVMTCPEAPEIVFQDFGVGELVGGYSKIVIDPIFSKNIVVDNNHPLKVYIQLEGNCNGVYVTNKTENGFEVKELNSGSSNAKFSWMIVANRANVEVLYSDGTTKVSQNADARFSPAPERVQSKSLNEDGVRKMINYKSVKK
jgi:hypothetical protein